MESIAQRLLFVRESSGFARKRFARLVDLSASHPKLLETGLIPDPSMPVLRRIADATGVAIEWIIFGIGETPDAGAIRARCERLEVERRGADAPDLEDDTDDIGTAPTIPPGAP